MKRFVLLAAVLLLLPLTTLAGLDALLSEGYATGTPNPAAKVVKVSSRVDAADPARAQAQLGQVHVALTGATVAKDMEGRDALVLALRWSHSKSEAGNFLYNVVLEASQGGKSLQPGLPVQGYAFGAASESVPAGVDTQVYYVLQLKDTTQDVYLKLQEFSLDAFVGGQSLDVLIDL